MSLIQKYVNKKVLKSLLAIALIASTLSGFGKEVVLTGKIQRNGEAPCTWSRIFDTNCPNNECWTSVTTTNKSLPSYAQETGYWVKATPTTKSGVVTWNIKVTDKRLMAAKSKYPVVSTRYVDTTFTQNKQSETHTVKEQDTVVTITTKVINKKS